MAYESSMDRIIKAVEQLRGKEFPIKAVVDLVNSKEDGSMRSIGTVTSVQVTKLAMGQRLIEPVSKQGCRTIWRAA